MSLLEYRQGPVLEDYPVDADETAEISAPPACPVNFTNRDSGSTPAESLFETFDREISTMQTWYDIASKTNPSHRGASRLTPHQILQLFKDFINDAAIEKLPDHQSLADYLRLAAEDLKSFYFKAITAQPGQPTDSGLLSDWFWGETYAAACINEVRKACLKRDTKEMQLAGKLLLVPRNQMHRFQE